MFVPIRSKLHCFNCEDALSIDNEQFEDYMPESVALDVFPNPFNSTASVTFELPVRSLISLVMFDISGQKIRTLSGGIKQSGVHTVNLTGVDLPSGLYFIRLQTPDNTLIRKTVLIR